LLKVVTLKRINDLSLSKTTPGGDPQQSEIEFKIDPR